MLSFLIDWQIFLSLFVVFSPIILVRKLLSKNSGWSNFWFMFLIHRRILHHLVISAFAKGAGDALLIFTLLCKKSHNLRTYSFPFFLKNKGNSTINKVSRHCLSLWHWYFAEILWYISIEGSNIFQKALCLLLSISLTMIKSNFQIL